MGIRLKAPLSNGDMAPLQWGMHLYASWDYMHLRAVSPHIPSGDVDPILGVPSLDYPSLQGICQRGYGTSSMGYAFYASWDFMHLGAIFQLIPSVDMDRILGVPSFVF